jgi:hypothetical protein
LPLFFLFFLDDIMKDIFDEVQFADLKLNSRIVRTGTWETETEDGGFLSEEVFVIAPACFRGFTLCQHQDPTQEDLPIEGWGR